MIDNIPMSFIRPGMTVNFEKGQGLVVLVNDEFHFEVQLDEAVTYRIPIKGNYDTNNLFNKNKFDRHIGRVVSIKF